MKAIQTRYLGATDFFGSRIKAWAEGTRSLTIPYPHGDGRDFTEEDAHRKAAQMLVDRQDWQLSIAGGALPNGDWGWVFVQSTHVAAYHANDQVRKMEEEDVQQ